MSLLMLSPPEINILFDYFHKVRFRERAEILAAPFSYGKSRFGNFFVAYYNQIRYFCDSGFPDLMPYLLIVEIYLSPYILRLQRFRSLQRIIGVPLGYGENRNL